MSVDGQQVAGSSFPVLVSIHPTQLSKHVKVWDGITYPMGITTNSEGDVIVSEVLGDIIKVMKCNKRFRCMRSNR